MLDSKYDLWDDGKLVHFDSSYDMAQSLLQLRSRHGQLYLYDITLRKHESIEVEYMDHDAYLKTKPMYNYQEELLKSEEANGQ